MAWYARFATFNLFLASCIETLKADDNPLSYLYAAILHDLQVRTQHMHTLFEGTEAKGGKKYFGELLRFRRSVYAHLLFFGHQAGYTPACRKAFERRMDLMTRFLIAEANFSLRDFSSPRWRLVHLEEMQAARTSSRGKSLPPPVSK